MPWVTETKLATNEINAMSEWNKTCYKWNKISNEIFAVQEWNQEWDIRREWNEIYFISFTVADQDAPWQLSRIHDVDGTY